MGAGYPSFVASELIVLPTAYRHDCTEDQIRYALAHVIAVFEDQGDLPLTIVTGSASDDDNTVLEVGFEVSDTGNVVVYHAMPARPRYLNPDETNEE